VSTSDVPDTMHIGELADRAGMSLRTIRHYDEVGLLVPSGRTTGGFRVYTAQDLERLLVIRRMKPLGFTLDEMAELLRVVDALATKDPEDEPVLAARLDA
jgi:MerR family copper efflux transcriptional regulator